MLFKEKALSPFIKQCLPMDVFECIRKRREVREYRDADVPDEAITRILEAGRLAA